MKKAETFAKLWGDFFVLILSKRFLLLPWALPSCSMYPLKKLPLENKFETAAPLLCKTGACLTIKSLAGDAGILFLCWHQLRAKADLCADPTSPAQRWRQGCCLCLLRTCRAPLVGSERDLWPNPCAAARWCTSSSTSVRGQQRMLRNAWQRTQFSLPLWAVVTAGCTAAGWRALSGAERLLAPTPAHLLLLSIQAHVEKNLHFFNKSPALACKDGISHTTKSLGCSLLVGMLWGFSNVLSTPPSPRHPSTKANWPRSRPAKAAGGRRATRRHPQSESPH